MKRKGKKRLDQYFVEINDIFKKIEKLFCDNET